MGEYINPTDLMLQGHAVMQGGEWWRLFSFMMIPRTMSALWLFFAFYIFYMIGKSLEEHWGTFRFNLFLLSGYLLTILTAFISPGAIVTNTYFLGCVFLAFATLFPQIGT
jgi:membrane associated rhomboid family serine protease